MTVKIKMTKDKEMAVIIKTMIKDNGGYCPCRIVKNADTMCMCKEFREAIQRREPGKCHCGLYEIVIEE